MELVKNNIDILFSKVNFLKKEKYEENINKLFNYWIFFDEKERDILELYEGNLEIVLYSKYYWCFQFNKAYNELYGNDVGIEQQQYKIIEEINQRLGSVNWEVLQMIEEEVY